MALLGLALTAAPAYAAPPATSIDDFGEAKAREIVLTDIGGPFPSRPGDPDDQQSLVRQLMYSNEIDLEAIIAVTSGWKSELDEASTSIPNDVFNAYEQVHPNLVKHDPDYPSAARLRSIFFLGQKTDGLDKIGEGKELSAGARAIIVAVDRPDPRPVWVTIWGGANTLAAALDYVRRTRSAAELTAFVSKLRVYTISDQDDTAPWLRKEFPSLFWVGTPSAIAPSSAYYSEATWTGISAEHFFRPPTVQRGPDSSLVTHAWLRAHIQSKGPLGTVYPNQVVTMEGDTGSWLWLVRNGLAGDRNPSWGGWGGRYAYRTPTHGPWDETRPFFTNGSCATNTNPDCTVNAISADTVIGFDGQTHTDDFATIYRWRDAYQYDFSNRMDWTVRDVADANHAPHVTVNRAGGTAPLYIDARPGIPATLDAAGTTDPDGDNLTYRWFHYLEAGRTNESRSPDVQLSDSTGPKITATASRPGQAHLILTVMDDGGTPAGDPFPGRAYRRIVLNVAPAPGEATTQPVHVGPSGSAPSGSAPICRAPRITLTLAGRPLRGTRRRPVVRAGRLYRYRIALRCGQTVAPRGTVVHVTSPRGRRNATRGVALDRHGRASLRVRLKRKTRITVRYLDKNGTKRVARLLVRVARRARR